jgi:fibronectin type 3 domain-containing protein
MERGLKTNIQENVSMGKIWVAVRFLLVAVAVATYLPACGSSSSSSTTATTAKSATWTNVSVRAFDGKVNINWDKAATKAGSAVSTYNVYCSTLPTDIKQDKNRIATGYAGTSFDHTDVANGQRYYYVVTEVNGAGEGVASRVVSATPDAVQPAAPFGLTVTANSKDSLVLLEWKISTPASGASVSYNLYRSTSRSGFSTASIIAANIPVSKAIETDTTTVTVSSTDNIASIRYTDLNIVSGTTYYYVITVVSAGKESAFSPVVSAQPQPQVAAKKGDPGKTLAAFASPASMTAVPGNGICTIKWGDVGSLETPSPDDDPKPYYVLYWSDSPDVLNNVKGPVNDVAKALIAKEGIFTYTLTGLTNGTTYYFQIAAFVKGADGVPTVRSTSGSVVAVTPAAVIPVIPNGVSATQGAQQVLLTWNKVTWAKGGTATVDASYNVYVSTTDAASPAELMAKGSKKNNDASNSSKAFYTHTGLEAGKTYYYVVTAVGEGESAPSSIVAVML